MRRIAIITAALLLGCMIRVPGQDRYVSGTVSCAYDSLPLYMVSIVVDGTTIGTTTNDQGEFFLKYPEHYGNKLCFSSVGFKDHYVEILEMEHWELHVCMEVKIIAMPEVTIVYDTLTHQSRSYLTTYLKDTVMNTLVKAEEIQSEGFFRDLR